MSQVTNRNGNDLPAPPRLLLWLAIGLFILILLAVIGAIIYFTGGQRLNSLIPYAIVVVALVPIVSIVAAIVFRRHLPRYFFVWLIVIFGVMGIAGAFGAVYGYRELLPPRYQEEMLTHVPFMRSFMRPTPVGGVIPTVVGTSAISPEDLLSSPLLLGATQEPVVAATAEATETQPPTATPEIPTNTPIPATQLIATAEPTQISAIPTALPTEALEALNASASNAVSYPASAHLFNLTHYTQEWNNCGPTNITMALSFFGWRENPAYAQRLIRPNVEDKNVSPHELVNFVNDQTFVKAIWRIGGDLDLIKALVASNIPVVIETGGPFAEGYDWIGHYQTVVGYDDNQRMMFLYDSYLGTGANGAGIAESYDIFDDRWQDFNRTFIVIYEPEREGTVAQLLGTRATPTGAAQVALDTAREESRANPSDPIPWFNMGTAFLKLGMNEEAASAYDNGRRYGLPFRMIWYQFGIFEAYYNVGRYSDILSIAQSVINDSGGNVEEAFYWQGRAYAASGDRQQAASSFNRALRVNPLFADARAALDTLNA